LTIDEFARKIRGKETTAAAVLEQCLERIKTENPRLNAFILVTADEARRQARRADEELAAGNDRGPLHGVPVSIKDLFDVTDTPTTAASHVRDGHVASSDATVITRLRRAGAVFIGKTNLHEFAFGTTNEDSGYGPARHPLDPIRSPGGSSGGSAASLAAGMALATLGTDTGGSIRIPAAICGTVGLKPTYGELPSDGLVPLSRTLDHVGPLTSTVSDAWHVFHALRGDTVLRPLVPSAVRHLRFGVPRKYFCDLLDHDVRRSFEAAIAAVRASGATIHDVEIPNARFIATVYVHIVFGDAAPYHAAALDAMPEKYTPPVRMRLEMARYVLAEDYTRALEGREVLRREVDAALSGYDALMLPTVPIPAFKIGTASVELNGSKEPIRNVTLRLTQLFNITGHPAISLPCGTTAAGFPCGLQLVGTRGQTDQLLHVAAGVERAVTPKNLRSLD
jgi:aspartyl-tRNA(Asn)/glutamyl-tRNA(Gln) amidotransferase subunit A